jgi:late competence protein required for DNA uptake (superfamily II DNA/RNA helicase)
MKFSLYLKEVKVKSKEPLFDYESADEVMRKMEKKINAPYISIQKSAFSRYAREKMSIIITLSLDPKEKWTNKILHNSRYLMWYIDRYGTIELFNKGFTIKTKFRKQGAKSVDEIIKKINTYIDKAEKETEVK